MQSTQGYSHIKTPFQDHNTKLFLLNSEKAKLSEMKKQISYSIKKEEYPERTNKKTECNSLDPKFKKEVMKCLRN